MAEVAFGVTLRSVRENRGFSQQCLADFCGLDRTYISLLERGRKSPTLRTTSELCAQLHISMGAFFTLVERKLREYGGAESTAE